ERHRIAGQRVLCGDSREARAQCERCAVPAGDGSARPPGEEPVCSLRLARAETRLDVVGNGLAFEWRPRAADVAAPDPRFLRSGERRAVAAHDLMLYGK